MRFHTAVGVAGIALSSPHAQAQQQPRQRRDHDAASSSFSNRGEAAAAGARLFTPSLANATEHERGVLAGERFVSGRPLETLLRDIDGIVVAISVQIATASAGAAAAAACVGADNRCYYGEERAKPGGEGGLYRDFYACVLITLRLCSLYVNAAYT